jgi:hypothetical protein
MALAAFRTFGDRLSGSPEDIIDALSREAAAARAAKRLVRNSSPSKRYKAR